MRRVLVIGSGGAGKSIFSKRLANRTGLPVIHLDRLYWREGWIEPSREEWNAIVVGLLAREEWIMDGNYGGTLDQRLRSCDTVIFLDLPRLRCLWRIMKRRIRYHRRSRPDMTSGCRERLSWEFVRWIWSYRTERRPGILQKLGSLRLEQRAVVLTSGRAVEEFLEAVPPSSFNPASQGSADG